MCWLRAVGASAGDALARLAAFSPGAAPGRLLAACMEALPAGRCFHPPSNRGSRIAPEPAPIIHIRSGSMLPILFIFLTKKPEARARGKSPIGDVRWNAQLYLRPGFDSTPDLHLRSDLRGSLSDSR